jgi:hypothetical protein
MKPETQTYIDTITPLLVHLKEGGKLIYNGIKDHPMDFNKVNTDTLTDKPERYSIHREPVAVFGLIREGLLVASASTVHRLKETIIGSGGDRIIRLVEDQAWKEGV